MYKMINFRCRSVAEKFDLGKSSLIACVYRVVNALNSIASNIIRWPKEQRLISIKQKFMRMGDITIPGIIGAVDGCYIHNIYIKKPNLQVFTLF